MLVSEVVFEEPGTVEVEVDSLLANVSVAQGRVAVAPQTVIAGGEWHGLRPHPKWGQETDPTGQETQQETEESRHKEARRHLVYRLSRGHFRNKYKQRRLATASERQVVGNRC